MTRSRGEVWVAGWISRREASRYRRSPASGGGDRPEPGEGWEAYLSRRDQGARPYFEALREELVSRGIRWDGERHSDPAERSVPLFNDGTAAAMSRRAWASLMAAAWSAPDGRRYDYQDFY